MYDLCGVLVHRGVAGGGHYYSFAKDRVYSRWYRFNDEHVSTFDPKHLAEECFGGLKDMGAVDSDTNAYILFYEKQIQPQVPLVVRQASPSLIPEVSFLLSSFRVAQS